MQNVLIGPMVKKVIAHKDNLGLRKHIVFAVVFVSNTNGIILLEDDLYVSPWFYRYAVDAARVLQAQQRSRWYCAVFCTF